MISGSEVNNNTYQAEKMTYKYVIYPFKIHLDTLNNFKAFYSEEPLKKNNFHDSINISYP